MSERAIPHIPFRGGYTEAKKLLHEALSRAVHNPDEDWPLDLVFSDPEAAAIRLLGDGTLKLEPEDVRQLKLLGKGNFKSRFDQFGGQEAVRALVQCLERMDMPEVTEGDDNQAR